MRAAGSTASRSSGRAGPARRLLLAAALLAGLAACGNFVLHGSGSEHGIDHLKAGVRF